MHTILSTPKSQRQRSPATKGFLACLHFCDSGHNHGLRPSANWDCLLCSYRPSLSVCFLEAISSLLSRSFLGCAASSNNSHSGPTSWNAAAKLGSACMTLTSRHSCTCYSPAGPPPLLIRVLGAELSRSRLQSSSQVVLSNCVPHLRGVGKGRRTLGCLYSNSPQVPQAAALRELNAFSHHTFS